MSSSIRLATVAHDIYHFMNYNFPQVPFLVKSISARFENITGKPKEAELIHNIDMAIFCLLVMQMDLIFIG